MSLINEAAVTKVAHTLREAIYEINEEAKKKALNVYIMYTVLEDPVYKAIKAQGKKLSTVNKLRTEAGMPEITEEHNQPVFTHNYIGHVTKNERQLGKGITFTASTISQPYVYTKVPAWLKKEAEKVAQARNLDYHAEGNYIYLGVKEGDAVLQ